MCSRAPSLPSEALTHRSALDRRPELKAAFPQRQRAAGIPGRPRAVARHGRSAAAPFPARAGGRAGAPPRRAGAGRDAGRDRDGDRPRRPSAPGRFGALAGAACGPTSWPMRWRRCWAPSSWMPASKPRPPAWRCCGATASAARPAAPRDPKTALQEWAQARRLPLPAYLEIDREGPPHAPVFVVDVVVKGHDPARGRGGSKREAERLAATTLLERLDRA